MKYKKRKNPILEVKEETDEYFIISITPKSIYQDNEDVYVTNCPTDNCQLCSIGNFQAAYDDGCIEEVLKEAYNMSSKRMFILDTDAKLSKDLYKVLKKIGKIHTNSLYTNRTGTRMRLNVFEPNDKVLNI